MGGSRIFKKEGGGAKDCACSAHPECEARTSLSAGVQGLLNNALSLMLSEPYFEAF